MAHRLHRLRIDVLADPRTVEFLGVNSKGQKFKFGEVTLQPGKADSLENMDLIRAAIKPHLPKSRS